MGGFSGCGMIQWVWGWFNGWVNSVGVGWCSELILSEGVGYG